MNTYYHSMYFFLPFKSRSSAQHRSFVLMVFHEMPYFLQHFAKNLVKTLKQGSLHKKFLDLRRSTSFAFKKRLVRKNKQVCSLSCDQYVILNTMNYLYEQKCCTLISRKLLKRWCGGIYRKSENNYQTFNKIQVKGSFGCHVGGQVYALQHGGQYKSYYFVEKSKCHKLYPSNVSPLKVHV